MPIILDPYKLSVARLKLSLNVEWPDDGCISLGWPKKTAVSIPDQHNVRITSCNYWQLGKPGKFFVRISNLIGLNDGVALSIAEVFHQLSEESYESVIDLTLTRKNDIMAVVEYLHGMLTENQDPAMAETSRDWQISMADFDGELTQFATLPIEKEDWRDEMHEDNDENRNQENLPEWLEHIVDELRYFRSDDCAEFTGLRAFMRMQRAWGCWMGAEGRMFGNIYNEALMRLETAITVVDRKLESDKDPAETASYASLLTLTLPALIEDVDRDKDINYVKSNCKWAARRVINKQMEFTADGAMLLLDIREENARIPKEFTAFMQKEMPLLIENEERAVGAAEADCNCLRKATLLAIKCRWSRVRKRLTPALSEKYYDELLQLTGLFKKSPDSESAYVIGRIYTEYLSEFSKEQDKKDYFDTVNQIIIDGLLSQRLSQTEKFNYASSCIEYLYTQADYIEGQSITEHHRLMHQMNLQEKKWYDESRGSDDSLFDLFF